MPDNEGELKKMRIDAHKKADYSDAAAATFEVMFNPNTYSQKYAVEYQDRQGQGDTGSPQVFGKVKPQDYAFEFLFDGTGAVGDKTDVTQRVQDFLTVTGKHDGEIHRPMYLKLSWGTLVSRCVLKDAEVTYTLFAPDGSPLRAKLKANFSENVEDTLRVAEERKNSPDLTHVHEVRRGEHLSLLCERFYNDPRRYLQIARFNGLTNFRRLEPGQRLRFPPIQDAK